jgi:hypothetical protein
MLTQRLAKESSTLFDYWDHLGPSKRRMLDKSWFRSCLLDKIPVEKLATLFNSEMGRPSKDLHVVVGALILQQLHDLTDQQAVEAIAFNISWHFALDIQNEKYAYICERTLRNYRQKIVRLGLDKDLFSTLTDELIHKFEVNTSLQRIDSTAIRSAMKSMTRLGAMVASIRKFLRELRLKYPTLVQKMGTEHEDIYLAVKSKPGCFDLSTPSETRKYLPSVAEDIFKIIMLYKDTDAATLESFSILSRLFGEQCRVVDGEKVEIKQPIDIPCDNVANPSDPDSSYNAHKGSGYMVQVMESYGEDDKEEDEKSLDLITHVAVHKMTLRDGQHLTLALDDITRRGHKPTAVLGDSHYGSRGNMQDTAAIDIDLVSPAATAKGAKAGQLTLDKFEFDAAGFVVKCPAGETPLSCTKGENRFLVRFENSICQACPNVNNCAVTAQIKRGEGARIQYDPGRVEYSVRRQYNRSDAFKAKYRWRAGIEATMSRLKYQMQLCRLRVRGKKSMQYTVFLRALGLNLLRCAAFVGISLLSLLLSSVICMVRKYRSSIFVSN